MRLACVASGLRCESPLDSGLLLPWALPWLCAVPTRVSAPHVAAQGRCSQLKSLLVVITAVPIFQLLQDPVQHCRSLFLRGLCGRWQRGEKTQRGLNSEGEAEVWGRHKESEWGIRGGGENTQVLVSPVSARRLSLASSCCWSPLHPLPSLPQSKGPTLGSQWPPESCFLPASQRPSQLRQQLGG